MREINLKRRPWNGKSPIFLLYFFFFFSKRKSLILNKFWKTYVSMNRFSGKVARQILNTLSLLSLLKKTTRWSLRQFFVKNFGLKVKCIEILVFKGENLFNICNNFDFLWSKFVTILDRRSKFVKILVFKSENL